MKIYITTAGAHQLDNSTFAPGTSAFRTADEAFAKVNADLRELQAKQGGEIVPIECTGPGRWQATLIVGVFHLIVFKIQEAELSD